MSGFTAKLGGSFLLCTNEIDNQNLKRRNPKTLNDRATINIWMSIRKYLVLHTIKYRPACIRLQYSLGVFSVSSTS